MAASDHLGDQFLYHGTAMNVEGDRLLPASVHGKGSYWGSTGSARKEPAQKFAWAVPDEERAWDFAHDRVVHTSNEHDWNPRARVYAVHPNEEQSPGHDKSIPGEVKAPHFEVAQRHDIMPGRQGTFPEVNWNNHVVHTGLYRENEDANHPTHLSVQFGHRYSHEGDHWNGNMRRDASKEDLARSMERSDAVGAPLAALRDKDPTLPGMAHMKNRFGRIT